MELFLLGAALAFSINIELGVVNVMIVRTAIDRGAEEEEFHGRYSDSMTLVGVLCGLLCAAGITPSLPAL